MSEQNTRPECDITKTQVMVDLFKIPQEERDDNWHQQFYDNVKTASYASDDPQVFTGPDGFPYFVLRTPEPNKPFESFCINNLKDDFLFENGIGVVLNPGETSIDWVFSYGDMVNLHLNGEFFSRRQAVEIKNEEVVTSDEDFLVAQPSESYLPKQTRAILKSFLQSIGVEQPKVMLVSRTVEGEVIQELAFNIFHEDFETTEILNYRLQQISWFLPRHYIIVSLTRESGFIQYFADL